MTTTRKVEVLPCRERATKFNTLLPTRLHLFHWVSFTKRFVPGLHRPHRPWGCGVNVEAELEKEKP